MIINNQYKEETPISAAAIQHFSREGEIHSGETTLLSEHLMDIYVNEILTMKLTCTPDNLPELTLGRLLTEGIIQSAIDVDSVCICEYGRRAKVFLKPGPARQESSGPCVDRTPTCCTGNQIMNDDFVQEKELTPLTPAAWQPEQVCICADRFTRDTPLHQQTRSSHSCFLMQGKEILFEAEDIGRHNAIDKAVGWALLHDIDLSSAVLFTSGRVPTDVIVKVIRSRVPVLFSKAAPTKDAVELAARFGLTLIGKVRTDGFVLYTS